jgi:hypothetical protein
MLEGDETMEKNESQEVDGAGGVRVDRLVRRGIQAEDIPAEDIETADAVADLVAERDQYLEALDDLKMHGSPVVDGWMSVPICEWEQVFERIGWNA